MKLQKSERIAQPVPPEAHAGNLDDDRIDAVHVGAHLLTISARALRSPEGDLKHSEAARRGPLTARTPTRIRARILVITVNTDFLLLVGERLAPGLARLDDDGRARARAIIDRAIRGRPPAVRRQLGAFLKVLRWAPAARYGRPFDRLPPTRQDAVLHWFQDAPIAPLRHGFWGVKTLVYMGYYGRPEAGPAIGYRPSRSGNDVLHAR